MQIEKKSSRTQAVSVLLLSIASLSILSKNAYAYLDPGSGSMILQVVLGAVLGAFFTLRMYWGQFKTFVQERVRKRR